MTCGQVRELLYEYLEGEMPREEAARLQAHLDSCENCRAIAEEYRRVLVAAGRLAPRDVPDFVTPAMETIRKEDAQKRVRSKRWIGYGVSVAAVLLLGVFVFGSGLLGHYDNGASSAPQEAPEAAPAARAEEAAEDAAFDSLEMEESAPVVDEALMEEAPQPAPEAEMEAEAEPETQASAGEGGAQQGNAPRTVCALPADRFNEFAACLHEELPAAYGAEVPILSQTEEEILLFIEDPALWDLVAEWLGEDIPFVPGELLITPV